MICPLIDPIIIDQCIQLFQGADVDYVANTTITNAYPRGSDVQVFSTIVLNEVSMLTSDPDDLENVSLYIYNHPEKYALVKFPPPPYSIPVGTRLTLDYKEDLDVIRLILDILGKDCTLQEICGFLDENPGIRAMNSNLGATYINDDTRNEN